MINCKMYDFKKITDDRGYLTPIEYDKDIPFKINRIYYIYGVKEGIRRGFHSHQDLEQILIAIHGSVKILVKNHLEEEIIELNDPGKGLYIGPMIWREMYDFSYDGVLLVLASKKYDELDYIRDYDKYLTLSKKYFKK